MLKTIMSHTDNITILQTVFLLLVNIAKMRISASTERSDSKKNV